jgi:hypothetical protein
LPLKKFSLGYRSRERTALRVTLDTPCGPLRTYNVHLDTRINGGDRVDQVADIIQDIDTAPGGALWRATSTPTRISGSCNTIPLPFLGRQGSSLEHYMARHGLRSAVRRRRERTTRCGCGSTGCSSKTCGRRHGRFIRRKVSDHHALLVSLTPAQRP